MLSEMNSELLWASGISVVIAVAAVLRIRIAIPDEFELMNWMDWCGHFALIGIGVAILGGLTGARIMEVSGILLTLALYPVAILGIIGRLDQLIVEAVRLSRKR